MRLSLSAQLTICMACGIKVEGKNKWISERQFGGAKPQVIKENEAMNYNGECDAEIAPNCILDSNNC